MKRLFFIFLLLLPALAFAQPSIKFDVMKHDFGEVKQGAQLEHVFEFTNTGAEDLLIKKLEAA